MEAFDKNDLKKLFTPDKASSGEDNGQVIIIGGSSLFHGAPLFALKVASRIVDMAFFASPEKSLGSIAEKMKSKLMSFVWVPWDDLELYIKKSDAILIGPGFMRFSSEKNRHHIHNGDCDEACRLTRNITKELLSKFSQKHWVIDAGSLQTMDADWIPKGSILTPNKKEFQILFANSSPEDAAKKYSCIIVLKGPETLVVSPEQSVLVKGGNAGMTKGGTGDVQAGLTVALLAKNDPFLAASCTAYLVKAAADSLYKRVGFSYNADDLADEVPRILNF